MTGFYILVVHMDEEQLIKLMNENGFTKKEIDKLLLAAEKYPATLEWVVREFARYYKPLVITLFILSAVLCIPMFSETDAAVRLFIFTGYLCVIFVTFKMYAMSYLIKCNRFMKILARKYEEAENDD